MKDERTKKDDFQKALAAYGEAVKEFRKERFDKAAELFQALIEKYPAERELADRARMHIAVCRAKAERDREAVPLKTTEDYYQFGVFKTNVGAFDEALMHLEKALKMSPDEGKISYALADLHVLMGQADAALEHLKKAIQADKFFRVLAQNETDFEPLWDDKKFKLITRIV